MPSHYPSDITSKNQPPAANQRDPNKPTLLVIDDEEGPRQSVKIIFKDEYNILLAKDGESALELARNNPVDVAVCDIMMPGISGTEVLRRLKEIDPTIEVIMLTAYETIDTARHAVRYGASDYLNKPFDIPTLRAAVAHARDKRQAAKKLHGNSQVLHQLQAEIHDQQLKEEMSRTKGEIYASVLHDINGPLTIISGFVEMINRSMENAASVEGEALATIRDDLTKLTGQVDRCFEISRRYLSFLRDKSAGTSQVGANQILNDLRDLLLRHPNARGHQLIIHNLSEDVMAEINGTDLLQILLNLTINALQATTQPHRVEVRPQLMEYALNLEHFQNSNEQRFINREGFGNRPPILAISVQDNGPGIPPDVLLKMFETKFTTKSADQGTGLGLSIIKRLVKEAEGAVHVHTRLGQGSTFTVCLPARKLATV